MMIGRRVVGHGRGIIRHVLREMHVLRVGVGILGMWRLSSNREVMWWLCRRLLRPCWLKHSCCAHYLKAALWQKTRRGEAKRGEADLSWIAAEAYVVYAGAV